MGHGAVGLHLPAGEALRWAGVLGLLAMVGRAAKDTDAVDFCSDDRGSGTGVRCAGTLRWGLRVFSDIFLRLIKTIVAPLILATLITGHRRARRPEAGVGRMGMKSLVYFEVLTTLALVIGLVAINLSKAGVGLALPAASGAAETRRSRRWHRRTGTIFCCMCFRRTLRRAWRRGRFCRWRCSRCSSGLRWRGLSEEKRGPVLRLCESLSEVMFKFTNVVMYFAPIGVGAAMAFTVGHMGLGVLVNLGKLLLTLYGALAAVRGAGAAAGGAARGGAGAAVPGGGGGAGDDCVCHGDERGGAAAGDGAMEALGVPRRIVAFVIPAGYSFNLDGSTLYLALASVFVAQAAGVHMGWGEQLLMMGTLVLTSKGVAGVPRATLVVLLATAATFRLPTEPIFVILGIDALMDMARTMVNVVGNCLASVVVARWEGQFGVEAVDPVVLEGMAQ